MSYSWESCEKRCRKDTAIIIVKMGKQGFWYGNYIVLFTREQWKYSVELMSSCPLVCALLFYNQDENQWFHSFPQISGCEEYLNENEKGRRTQLKVTSSQVLL